MGRYDSLPKGVENSFNGDNTFDVYFEGRIRIHLVKKTLRGGT